MKSITIHGVDEQLATRLQRTAQDQRTSVNRVVKRLLEEALGLKPRPAGRNREHFEAFAGLWTEQDLEEFRRATAALSQVDGQDWQ